MIGSEAMPPLVHMMFLGDGSGASSLDPCPRANIDLNLPLREEVEVPVERAPRLDINMIPP